MKNIFKHIVIAGAFVLLNIEVSGQQTKVDSLNKILQKATQDTTQLRIYFALIDACDTKENLKYGEPTIKLLNKLIPQAANEKEREKLLSQKADAYGSIGIYYDAKGDAAKYMEAQQMCLSIYKEIKDTAAIIQTIIQISKFYESNNNFSKALEYIQMGLAVSKEMNFKRGTARCLAIIAQMYDGQGDHVQAIANYQNALSISYEIKDTAGCASDLVQIGNINGGLHYLNKALECYQKAGLLYEKMRSKWGRRFVYNCTGLMYEENNNIKNALINLEKCLSLSEEMKDNYWIGVLLDNIGNLYYKQGDISKALDFNGKALKINKQYNDGYRIGFSYYNMARNYLKQKEYRSAKDNIDRSIEVRDKMPGGIAPDYELLASRIDSAVNDKNGAYERYKDYIRIRDLNSSDEVKKAAQKEKFQSEYDKQKAIEKAEQDKKDVEVESEKKKQKIIIWSTILGLLFAVVFAGFIFRSLRITSKQKIIIEEKNKLVEEKNHEITDSINYAQRIQQSILPPLSEISNSLPNSFVLFKPKDIVSGDFYWFHKTNSPLERGKGCVFIAACDCTGHGVPGAFMSTIGSEKLNEAVKESNDVSVILNLVNRGMKKVLRQSGKEDSTRDGMDIALCAFNNEMTQIEYAGANRPLWIIRNNTTEIEETKATKVAIGGLTDDEQVFTKHTFDLHKGDSVYIFTDGYADQFSPQDKKLMTRKFKEIFLSIQDKPMEEQKNYLSSFIENWKGNLEQTDDILVIGIRI